MKMDIDGASKKPLEYALVIDSIANRYNDTKTEEVNSS
jgi:hypothetical protein